MLSDALVEVASSAHAQAPADDQNLPLTAALSWGVLNPSTKHWLSSQFGMQPRAKTQAYVALSSGTAIPIATGSCRLQCYNTRWLLPARLQHESLLTNDKQ